MLWVCYGGHHQHQTLINVIVMFPKLAITFTFKVVPRAWNYSWKWRLCSRPSIVFQDASFPIFNKRSFQKGNTGGYGAQQVPTIYLHNGIHSYLSRDSQLSIWCKPMLWIITWYSPYHTRAAKSAAKRSRPHVGLVMYTNPDST